MAHLRAGAFVLSLVPVLAACTQWTHQRNGPEHFSYDNAVCVREALESVQPSYQQQQYTTKSGKSQSYTIDASESLRDRWRRNCLQRGGWVMHFRSPWSGTAENVPRSPEQPVTAKR